MPGELVTAAVPSEWGPNLTGEGAGRDHGGKEYEVFVLDINFFTALGNYMFVYNCHLNVVPV